MDNLTALLQLIGNTITDAGGDGSILASAHRGILETLLQSTGKFTGAVFKARQSPNMGVVPTGTLFFNGNALNETNDFVITTSKNSADLNDFGLLLQFMAPGDIIKFKDFSGRSVYFIFKSFVAAQDSGGSDIYNITVSGVAENSNYSYQPADDEISVVELTISGVNPQKVTVEGVVYNYKKNSANGTFLIPEQYDIAEYGIREINDNGDIFNVVQTLVYNVGDPALLASWEVVLNTEINF